MNLDFHSVERTNSAVYKVDILFECPWYQIFKIFILTTLKSFTEVYFCLLQYALHFTVRETSL